MYVDFYFRKDDKTSTCCGRIPCAGRARVCLCSVGCVQPPWLPLSTQPFPFSTLSKIIIFLLQAFCSKRFFPCLSLFFLFLTVTCYLTVTDAGLMSFISYLTYNQINGLFLHLATACMILALCYQSRCLWERYGRTFTVVTVQRLRNNSASSAEFFWPGSQAGDGTVLSVIRLKGDVCGSFYIILYMVKIVKIKHCVECVPLNRKTGFVSNIVDI